MSADVDTASSFAELFPLAECDEEGFFWHADGSVSQVWLAHPISAEHLPGDTRHHIANNLGKAVAQLTPGATVQFIVRAVPNIDWAINNYLKNGGTKHKWWKQYEAARVKAIRQWTSTLESANMPDVNVKDIQIFIVLTVYESQDDTIKQIWKDVKDSLGKPQPTEFGMPALKKTKAHRRTEDAVQSLASQIRADRDSFEKSFAAMHLPFLRANQEAVIRFTRSLVDPVDGPTDPVVLDPELFLPELVCTKRVEFLEGGKYVKCNGSFSTMLSTETYPDDVYAGILSLNNQNFTDDRSLIDFLGDGVMMIACKVVERTEALAFLDRREKQSKGDKSEAVEKVMAHQDVQEFKDWIKNQRRVAVDMCISVKVVGKSPFEVDQKAKAMLTNFQALQFAMRVEDTDVKTVWCEQLPGGFNKTMSASGQRVRRRRDIAFCALTPLYLSGRGTKKFVHLAFNQHFEPYAFDHFSHRSSFNVAVLGIPGAGKSVKIQDIVSDNMRQENARAYIIDWGGSFTGPNNITDQDGCDAALSLENKQPCNIFNGPIDTTLPMLLQWIPDLALNADEKLDPRLETLISKSLQSAYRKATVLRKPYQNAQELATRYPGYWPLNPRKRFHIKFLEPAQQNLVKEMLKGEEALRPKYQVYYKIRILSYPQSKVNTRRVPRTIQDLGSENIQRLEDDFAYLEQDDEGPYVLSSEISSMDVLTRLDWDVCIDDKYLIVEARDEKDFRALMSANVTVIFDEEWRVQQFRRIRDVLEQKCGADHPNFKTFLQQDMDRLDPLQYFHDLTGQVDLQGEIIFSDFIREAKTLNDPEFNRFLERLSMWYGSGTYGEYFDRRGGIDLSKYRMVVWDFKPIWAANNKFVLAMLGAVITKIQVYCDSYLTLGLRKNVVMDEYHEFRTRFGAKVVRFVDRTTLQARKNQYCMILGTQKFEHIEDTAGTDINLLDQFQHYWIGSQMSSSILRLKEKFSFTDEMCYVASQARMMPGKYVDMCLFIPADGTCEMVRSIQTTFEIWFKSSSPKEREMRLQRISHYQREFGKSLAESTILASQELAEKYPRGLAAANIVEIQ